MTVRNLPFINFTENEQEHEITSSNEHTYKKTTTAYQLKKTFTKENELIEKLKKLP